jgi:hypothetical protein
VLRPGLDGGQGAVQVSVQERADSELAGQPGRQLGEQVQAVFEVTAGVRLGRGGCDRLGDGPDHPPGQAGVAQRGADDIRECRVAAWRVAGDGRRYCPGPVTQPEGAQLAGCGLDAGPLARWVGPVEDAGQLPDAGRADELFGGGQCRSF